MLFVFLVLSFRVFSSLSVTQPGSHQTTILKTTEKLSIINNAMLKE